MAGSDEGVRRLAAVIEQQRREISEMRAAAAVDSVIATARGALMERLGCSLAVAGQRLNEYAAAAGLPLAEMAAAIIQQPAPDPVPAAAEESPAGDAVLAGDAVPAARPLSALLADAAMLLAADGPEMVSVLAGQAADQVGAVAVAVWMLEADGTLALLGAEGFGGAQTSRWQRVPPQLDCPAQRVARGAPGLWWPAGQRAARAPAEPGGPALPVIGDRPGAARVVLPLRQRAGELLGVLEISWPGPLPGFALGTDIILSALAAGCADVLAARLSAEGAAAFRAAAARPAMFAMLDEIAGPVLVTSAVRAADGRVTDFLIEYVSEDFRDENGRTARELTGLTLLKAYPASVCGPGLFAVAAASLAGTPTAPDTETARNERGGTPRAVRWYDGVIFSWRDWRDAAGEGGQEVAGRFAALLENAQRLGHLGAWEEDLADGSVRWTDSVYALFGLTPNAAPAIPLADLPSFVIAPDRPGVTRLRADLLENREPAAVTFRILRPDDESIRHIRVFAEPVAGPSGAVVALRGAFQDVSAHYHTQVALAVTRDQLADSEQRAAEEHHLAVRLQQAIMPPDAHPVEVEGMEIAVRYRPAGPGHLVGGDWYDTLLLPNDDVLLVVGDVTGHGIDAVTGMVAARNALRGLAVTGAGPAELVAMLNKVACTVNEGVVGTVVCGRYYPATRLLRWARAGHLPPVLVRGAGARALPLPSGILLGMDPDGEYEESTEQLAAGDTLLLFTDGLIEQRGGSIGDALADFVVAAGPAGQPAAAHADRLMAATSSDTGDDACLVAVAIR
jgi:PAS domain-containing protein